MEREDTWLKYDSILGNGESESGPVPAEVYHPDDLDLDRSLNIHLDYHRKGADEVFPAGGKSPSADAERALKLRAFADFLEIQPETVYYLGCRRMVTPSAAFPEADVLYLDIDSEAMDDLHNSGFNAIKADAEEFNLEDEMGFRPDLIFMNDYGGPAPGEVVSINEKSGQWIIADGVPDYRIKRGELDPDESVGEKLDVTDRMDPQYSVKISQDGYVEIFEGRKNSMIATKVD